jgi:hypothetical protein
MDALSLDWNSPVRLITTSRTTGWTSLAKVRMRFHAIPKTCAFFRATARHNATVWMNCIVLVDLDQRMSA